jgi:hypothetical protein
MMKKVFYSLILPAVLFFSGCGYQFGSIAHPQLSSIAVAPVINDTIFYNGSAMLRGLLSERVTVDGSLKLKDARSADCILYARITDVTYQATDSEKLPDGTDAFMPGEWKCEVKVEYSVVLPGRAKPLVSRKTAKGSAMFTNGPDLETSRQNGMRMALFAAAKNVISGIVEGW